MYMKLIEKEIKSLLPETTQIKCILTKPNVVWVSHDRVLVGSHICKTDSIDN